MLILIATTVPASDDSEMCAPAAVKLGRPPPPPRLVMLLMLLHEARVANEARVIRSGSRWNMGMGAVYSKFDLDASDWTVLFRSRESLWTVQALGIRH